MSEIEKHPQQTPEAIYEELFMWRPPLPVDQVDIGGIIELASKTEATEPGYAWGRLPRWLAEVEESFRNIGPIPIVCLDVCSSLPFYAQLLRASEFTRSGRRAKDISNELFDGESINLLRDINPDLVPLNVALSTDKVSRQLLQSAIQEVIYTLTIDDKDVALDPSIFRIRISNILASQRLVYKQDASVKDIETGWGFRYNSETFDETYVERLMRLEVPTKAALAARKQLAEINKNGHSKDERKRYQIAAKETEPVSPELVIELLLTQTDQIANIVQYNDRYLPARFLSMDFSSPEDIAVSSIHNTPQPTQQMHLFSHALRSLFESNEHLVGDIFQPLNFPDNTFALITDFDGWPFHFQVDPTDPIEVATFIQNAKTTISHFYDKLAYGGKLVIFPWAISNGGQLTQNILDRIVVDLANQFHHGIDRRVFHRDTLKDWMSESDVETSESISPIFITGHEFFEALIINKPKKALAKQNAKLIGKLATN